MSEQQNKTEQETALQRMVERAQRDSAFRAELTADPKGILERELGIELPDDADIRVVEEAPNQLHLVLPTQAEALSEEALDQVTAGLSDLKALRARLPWFPVRRLS